MFYTLVTVKDWAAWTEQDLNSNPPIWSTNVRKVSPSRDELDRPTALLKHAISLSWDEQVCLSSLSVTMLRAMPANCLPKGRCILCYFSKGDVNKHLSTHPKYGNDDRPKKQFHPSPAKPISLLGLFTGVWMTPEWLQKVTPKHGWWASESCINTMPLLAILTTRVVWVISHRCFIFKMDMYLTILGFYCC